MSRWILIVASIAAVSLVTACTAEVGVAGEGDGTQTFKTFSTNGVVGMALQQVVLKRAEGIARQNRPYVFNGVQDCYGYVRQVWNAILTDGSAHTEDFYPKSYNRSRWLYSGGLPVADAPNSNWVYFSTGSVLLPGDVLSTDRGHRWGSNWHGGIYAGKTSAGHRQWDNSPYSGNGAYNRPLYSGFRYYYKPTHDLLAKSSQPAPTPPSGYKFIISRHSGKCLEASSAAGAAQIWQATCKSTPAQHWKPESVGEGYYRFISELSGKCLDIFPGTLAQGAQLKQWDCNYYKPQSFKMLQADPQHVTLVARHSGKCLDVYDWLLSDEAKVVQWSCHGGNNQQWRLSTSTNSTQNVTCPPAGTSWSNPAVLGDLAGKSCSYTCWGKGSFYNRCGTGRWQFCHPNGKFAACQWMQ